jgi:hypothetical protein
MQHEPEPAQESASPESTEAAGVKEHVATLLEDVRLLAETGMELSANKSSEALPHTDAALKAALADTFVVEDLRAEDQKTDFQQDELDAVLLQAEMVMVGGQRRLRLSDEARGKLLTETRESDRFRRMLDEVYKRDNQDFDAISDDPVRLPTAWLRCFLIGEFGNLPTAPVGELRAAVTALEDLRCYPRLPPNVPSLDEAKRRLQFAELLEPLRILIGASGGWDGSPRTDRFIGRQRELRALRSFVDELQSEGFLEAITRGAGRMASGAVAAVTGPSPAGVMVWAARGGLGKTALIAKFVLNHALAQSRPFPFAFLDFDRGALQPRDPRLLLVEVAGQVALQFTAVAELSELRRQLRAEIADPQLSRHPDPFGSFRRIMRDQITHGQRAFLVVLDTMELVQYDPSALLGVTEFIDKLYDGEFPELRVVAAGRADIPELRQTKGSRAEGALRSLGPLSSGEAAEMAERLGRGWLGPQWQPIWAKRIAGRPNDPPQRREPLSIRVAVELLRAAKDETERDSLSREIELQGENAHEDFAAALYQRRVVDHVRDPEVRTLAWPGLVFRRVTRDIVRDVLVPLCGLPLERVDAAFEGLAREVWIVEQKGDALQHRADLRARTLPLMRRYNRELFDKVNSAAIDYFSAPQATSLADRAEWFYHRLLRGDPPEDLERNWSEEVSTLLAGADADLEPGSKAANFLAAMTSTRLMPGDHILQLPSRLALEHLARTAPQFGAFDDTSLQPLLVQLRLEEAFTGGLVSPLGAAAGLTLAVKTGRWGFIPAPSLQPGAWRDYQDYALQFIQTRVRSTALPPFFLDRREDDHGLQQARNLSTEAEWRLALRSLAEDLAASRLTKLSAFEHVDYRLGQILAEAPARLFQTDQSTLRLVMLFGERSFQLAIERWLEATRASASEAALPSISLAEIWALSIESGSIPKLFWPLFEEARLPERALKSPDAMDTALRFESSMVPRLLLAAVSDLRADRPQAIRRFAAARNEDWLLPLAYAVARTWTSGELPRAVLERVSSHDPKSMTRWLPRPGASSTADDNVLQLLRGADQAGDLAMTASLFLPKASGAGAADLQTVLTCLAEWRRRIGEMIDPGSVAVA